MSRLRALLIEHYRKHCERVACSNEPRMRRRVLKAMPYCYGQLLASVPKGGRVLDLGCGMGLLLEWLSKQPGIMAAGVDNSPTQVEVAREVAPDAEMELEDGLTYLKRHPNTFSGVFCLDVLEHIPGADLCLEWVEAVREALRPGGFFYCRAPNAANLFAAYSRYMDLTHERIFTGASMLQLLEAAGFERCLIAKDSSPYLSGKLRRVASNTLHRILFRVSGRLGETKFSVNVAAVGYKPTGVSV